MGSIIKYVYYVVQDYYKWLDSFSDPRTENLFLIKSVTNILILSALYWLMVWLGPKIMQNKQPFQFRRVLIIYSFSMALLNLYISEQSFTAGYRLNYNFFCQAPEIVTHPYELQLATASWLYFLSRIVEFLDTAFFILRKKSNQLSFLHVYHHSSMLVLTWAFAKWMPTGSMFGAYSVNCFVHVVMYTYYGLTAFGPHMEKYLWWKKYVTVLQLIQFMIGWLGTLNSLRIDCGYPVCIRLSMHLYMTSYIILFGRFYLRAYHPKKSENATYSPKIKAGEMEQKLINEVNKIHGKKCI